MLHKGPLLLLAEAGFRDRPLLLACSSRDLVSELEQTLQIPASESSAKGSAQDTERQLVFDVVGQYTLILATGANDVLVKPAGKRALHHTVGEHFAWLVRHVLRDDRLPERPCFDLQDHAGSHLERSRWLQDPSCLPGRLQPFERVRRLVECKHRLRACIDHTLFDESHDCFSF